MSIQVVHRENVPVDSDSESDERTPIIIVNDTAIKVKGVRVHTGTGWFSSSFLVVNAALGAGLLNFPMAYHQAGGIAIALSIQAVFVVFVVVAIMILGYCSDIKNVNTYQDVVQSVCGPKAQLACAMSIMLYCFGTCITFLIIIGDQWELFFLDVSKTEYCGDTPFYMTRSFTVVISSLLFILPLCFPRRIDFLKYTSIIGVIGILYVVGLITLRYFLTDVSHAPVVTRPHSWMDIFLVVPTICFGYQCHVSVIPIYSCMKNRNLKNFSKTITVAITLCVLTYSFTASLGYLQVGADGVTNDILLSFNQDAAVMVAVVLIAFKTYTTYPILQFCGRAALDCVWKKIWNLTPQESLKHERRRHIAMSLVWFTLTLLLSVFIPNIGVVIQILGSLAAVFIFIFPGLCLLKAMQDRIESDIQQPKSIHFLRVFAIGFIILGVFIFGLTFTQAIMRDVKGTKPDSSKFTCN